MKSYQIYYALILFQLIFISLENEPIQLEKNNILILNLTADEVKTLNFSKSGGIFNISILSLNADINLNITEVTPKPKNDFIVPMVTNNAKLDFGSNINEGKITFSSKSDVTVEITSVLSKKIEDNLTDPYYYDKKGYEVDTELKTKNNNFVIFLDDENVTQSLDMKFKFNESSPIKGKKVTYGFLYLPNQENQYLALGKYYKNLSIGNLSEYEFNEYEKELKVISKYHKQQNGDKVKTKFAFIFSIDSEEMIGQFSFSINSEIINVFLIVSIVIALVFAVITFFLIRRKQSAESTNIEGNENLLKDNKEEGEKEEKGENEKEEKEGGEEKEEKEDKIINDENAEEEQKKIEAAEN